MSFLLNKKMWQKGYHSYHREGPLKVQTCTQQVLYSTWCFTIQSVWIHHTKEWNTFKELHTTPEAMACSNRMKELIQKNKFKHRLGPSGYKVVITLWTKKEQELREAGIPDPLEGYMLHTRS
jgi:hypothetical protein